MRGISEHLSLGDRFHAAAVPKCSDVLRLAKKTGIGGQLAVVYRPPNIAINLDGSAPGAVGRFGETAGLFYPKEDETFPIDIKVPADGAYEIGIDGTFASRLELRSGDRVIAAARHQLNWPSEYNPLALVRLRKGSNRLTLRYTGPDVHPGSAAQVGFGLGPLIVGRIRSRRAEGDVRPRVEGADALREEPRLDRGRRTSVVRQNDAGEAPGLPGVERARAAP